MSVRSISERTPVGKAEQTREIREANPLLDVLTDEGHTPRRSGAAGPWTLCCPLHQEKTPSFHLYPDGGFKCFGCGAAGDVFDYVRARDGVDFITARHMLAQRAGLDVGETSAGNPGHSTPVRPTVPVKAATPPVAALTLPADAHRPEAEEIVAIAHARRLNPESVSLAGSWGLLLVGTVCRQPSWLLTDASGHVAEARRMDGKPFPAHGDLGERKVHTLRGSVKSWPCGLAPAGGLPGGVRAILLVEGGPDFLAALHFCLDRDRFDLWPVAMLGAGTKTLHPDALRLLSGRRVRLYPHDDPSGGEAGRRWAEQLRAAGCTVDGFNCAGIPRRDGRPCKDLNDLALAAPGAAADLTDLLP